MKTLYVIAASQDYSRANHIDLWNTLSLNADVVVVNIPADYFVTVMTGKKERIVEAKAGPLFVSSNLAVVRPLLFIRPEIRINILKRMLAKQFWKAVNAAFCLSNFEEIRLIIYNAFWAEILYQSIPNLTIGYYLFDEVRTNQNNQPHEKRYKEDLKCCELSDCIFAMSSKLMESRKEFEDKITVIGNGASYHPCNRSYHFSNSCAFVGNFRDWIDFDMLNRIIELNQSISFFFVGPVEEKVKGKMKDFLFSYKNVFYCGIKPKSMISSIYSSFDVVIIPYKQNAFIQATRPIKIVESVFAGTPVVTVPVAGYEEHSFIKFAKTAEEFSKEIRTYIDNPIDLNSDEYKDFVSQNTWECKANQINQCFSQISKEYL